MRRESKADADRRRLEQLEAEAVYAQERFDLYKAKVYGPRQTSITELRRLQQAALYAEARLRRARREA